MTTATKRFAIGFTLAVIAACVLNAVPFFLTRGAYNGDGFEVIGFPFTFRRLGGNAGIYEFRKLALCADIVIGVLAAFIAGRACTGFPRRA